MTAPLTVTYLPGLLAIVGPMEDIDEHRHHALQVVWPGPDGVLEVAGQPARCRDDIVLIAADTPHRYRSPEGALLLISPESHLGVALAESCRDGLGRFRLKASAKPTTSEDLIRRFFADVAPTDCLEFHQGHALSPLLQAVQSRVISGDMGDVDLQWACEQVHLSESRFMHRFKAMAGIAWRPFLLWSRLIAGVLRTAESANLTEAALAVGFSDGAHFSRTFRSHFGIAPSTVAKNSRFIQAPPLPKS